MFYIEDFNFLKTLLDNHKRAYLLNLSITDPEMIGIFGEPNMVTEHHSPTMVYDQENSWSCGYWWKLEG